MEAVEALLRVDAVDPNIPDENGVTPLIEAIGNRRLHRELRIAMALLLLRGPRTDVNRRGPGNKLPLEIAFEEGLAPRLFNAIYQQGLKEYAARIRGIASTLGGLFNSYKQQNPRKYEEFRSGIRDLYGWRFGPNGFFCLPLYQSIGDIDQKIDLLLDFNSPYTRIADQFLNSPHISIADQLCEIRKGVQLYRENLSRLGLQKKMTPDELDRYLYHRQYKNPYWWIAITLKQK
jgi:hypothetical protein